MMSILQSKSNKQMNIEFFEELLVQAFGEDVGEKQLDLSGLVTQAQITSLLQLELTGVPRDTTLILVAVGG